MLMLPTPPHQISITILDDNHAPEGLECENGFSLWIQMPGKRILFDTGPTTAMLRNASSLGVALETTDAVVLSHGHYDHTSNLEHVLACAPRSQLYYHPRSLVSRYSIHDFPKPIGMPPGSVDAITELPAERSYTVTAPVSVAPGVWLTGPVPRRTTCEDTGGPFFLDAAGSCPDDIMDDMSLWFEADEGLVVCLGCCHSGIINTLRYISELTPGRVISTVIGGMHLLNASTARYVFTANALKGYSLRRLIPCHCTGDGAYAHLAAELGDVVQPGYVGMKQIFRTTTNL